MFLMFVSLLLFLAQIGFLSKEPFFNFAPGLLSKGLCEANSNPEVNPSLPKGLSPWQKGWGKKSSMMATTTRESLLGLAPPHKPGGTG